MNWVATVTRVNGDGRPFIRCQTLAGESELGPLLAAQPRITVPDGVGVVSYAAGDTVLVADVQGSLTTYVVVARLA